MQNSGTGFSEKGRRNTMNKELPTEYQRFNAVERIQHIILFTSFLLLAFTGWA
jgi:hypothetical protein